MDEKDWEKLEEGDENTDAKDWLKAILDLHERLADIEQRTIHQLNDQEGRLERLEKEKATYEWCCAEHEAMNRNHNETQELIKSLGKQDKGAPHKVKKRSTLSKRPVQRDNKKGGGA